MAAVDKAGIAQIHSAVFIPNLKHDAIGKGFDVTRLSLYYMCR